MRVDALHLLRCPFCGGRLSLVDNQALVRTDTEIASGVLGCACCAFPIVDGIPVMIADEATREAMHALEAGQGEAALFALLGLGGDADRAERFRALLASGDAATYRDAIAILSPDAEGTYFVYRFSDPTFLLASAVLEAVTRHPEIGSGRCLDLCGGSGHLTRVLAGLTSPDRTVLADLYFWKLWLARHFTAPGGTAVCCDANHPLPFARDAFTLAVCSDAFPYIWHKRLMADEMMRLAGRTGAVVLPHLHSALGENFTAGMTLTPEGYRDLFEPLGARLFRDSALLDQVLGGEPLDLGDDAAPESLAGEPSLTLIATARTDLFRAYEAPALVSEVRGELIVNPLYRVEHRDSSSTLTLSFPTGEYEAEFGECKRYLPATITLPGDVSKPFARAALGDQYAELLRRHVILDAPRRYC